jgi:hypothetical protein
MKLYRIITHFWGKDLYERVMLEYVVAINDDAIYEYISRKYRSAELSSGNANWDEMVNMTREEIIAAHGDLDSDLQGEFYDQKYGWEELGEVTLADFATLKKLGIVDQIVD